MAFVLVVTALCFFQVAFAGPAITLEDLEIADDTMSVGSYVREVRAAASQDFHKSYESDGDGEIGYSRKKSGGGKKGYQHFDSFHKKAGDNYEFEKQDSYGQDNGGQQGAHSENHEQKAEKYRERPSDAERLNEGAEDPDEKHHEELKEGANDGNGGKEAYGHDPADYALPEKYTYGSGDEYNF